MGFDDFVMPNLSFHQKDSEKASPGVVLAEHFKAHAEEGGAEQTARDARRGVHLFLKIRVILS